MTRRSKRELERAVDGLDDDGDGVDRWPMIVFEREDGGYVDADGNDLPTDDAGDLDAPADGGPLFVMPPEVGEFTRPDDLPGATRDGSEGG